MPDSSSKPILLNQDSKARFLPGLFAPKSLLHNLLDFGIDLLFPPRCAGCGRVDTAWCENCQQELDLLPFPQSVRVHPPLSGIASTSAHIGKIQTAIWSLKYENGYKLAQPLGQRLAQHFNSLNWTIDMVVPVPLHTKRLAERGYNQSQLLAEYLTAHIAIPCEPQALRRERQTQAQVTLNAADRQTNMQNAFSGNPSLLTNRTILLIDDVYTTGATLAACAEAALSAGAQAVYALTLTAAGI